MEEDLKHGKEETRMEDDVEFIIQLPMEQYNLEYEKGVAYEQ